MKPRVTKVLKIRKVKENMRRDKKLTALKPGVRVSKSGNRYTETRSNRADSRPKYRL